MDRAWLARGSCGGSYLFARLAMASTNSRHSPGQTMSNKPGQAAEGALAIVHDGLVHGNYIMPVGSPPAQKKAFLANLLHEVGWRNKPPKPSCCVYPQLTHPLHPYSPQRWWWSTLTKWNFRQMVVVKLANGRGGGSNEKGTHPLFGERHSSWPTPMGGGLPQEAPTHQTTMTTQGKIQRKKFPAPLAPTIYRDRGQMRPTSDLPYPRGGGSQLKKAPNFFKKAPSGG